jgi:hypothetical protein
VFYFQGEPDHLDLIHLTCLTFSGDESSTVDLEPVHRRPRPALWSGQEETRKSTRSRLLIDPSGLCSWCVKRTMNISKQLQVLQLGAFIGRPHSGIDVGLMRFPLGLP